MDQSPPENNMSRFPRVLRFLGAGLVNTCFGYVSYLLFVLTGMPLWLAVVGSTITALLFNFLTYGGIVFNDISTRNLPRFLVFYTALALFNYGGLLFLQATGIKPIVGQAILLPLLALMCYGGLRLFVFRAAPHGAQ